VLLTMLGVELRALTYWLSADVSQWQSEPRWLSRVDPMRQALLRSFTVTLQPGSTSVRPSRRAFPGGSVLFDRLPATNQHDGLSQNIQRIVAVVDEVNAASAGSNG
jgi:hypothetical protein